MNTIELLSRGWFFLAAGTLVASTGCGLADTGTMEPSGSINTSGGSSSGIGGEGGTGGTVETGGSGGAGAMGGAGGGGAMGGTGGGASSSSSSSSSSGAMGTPENCADGVDNDLDGKIDCADTNDCGTVFSCTAPPPGGWAYVRLRKSSFGGAKETCGNGKDPQILYENADLGQCNNCSCTAPGKCEIMMTCYANDNCTGLATSATYSTDADSCTPDTVAAAGGSCQLTGAPKVPMGATCNSAGGGLKNADPWMGELHLCAANSKAIGCGANSCVLEPSGTYEDRLCVAQPGKLQCPAGYPEQHQGFGMFTDTRMCSACSCNANAITCTGSSVVTLWSNSNCTQNAQSVSSNNGCVNVPLGIAYRNVTGIASMTVSSCPSPTPAGSVSGTDATTVCCAVP